MFGLIPHSEKEMASRERAIMSLFPWADRDFFGNFTNSGMKVDIKETDNAYELEAELAGFDKKDINIDYSDGYLTISAKKEASKDENEDNYIRKERSSCSLQRSFYLENVDKETASAEFDKGVLKINLPKTKDVEKKKDNSIIIK